MSIRICSSHCRKIASACALALLSAPASAATLSTWLNPVSGDWTESAKWSTNPNYPRNGFPDGGITYDALINQTGAAYLITNTMGFELDSLTLDSPNATLQSAATLVLGNLNVNAGTFNLTGGGIHRATIAAPSGSTAINILASSFLNEVAVGGGINIAPGVFLDLLNARSFAGGSISIGGTPGHQSVLSIGTNQNQPGSLLGTGEIVFNGTNSFNNFVKPLGAGTLTIGPDFVIRTGARGGGLGSDANPLINQGLISAQTANQILTISGQFTNNGTLELKNAGRLQIFNLNGPLGNVALTAGHLELYGSYSIAQPFTVSAGNTLSLHGNWSSPAGLNIDNGTLNLATLPSSPSPISATNATLNLIAGFTTAQLETIPQSAFIKLGVHPGSNIQNQGQTLHIPAGGQLLSYGGIIYGGTIDGPADARLIFPSQAGGQLQGVTVNVDSLVQPRSTFQFFQGITINRTITLESGTDRADLMSSSSDTISGTGQIIFNGTDIGRIYAQRSGTLTIGSGITVRSGTAGGSLGELTPGFAGTVNNAGLVLAETPGKFITIYAYGTNSGTMESRSGGGVATTIAYTNTGAINIGAGSFFHAGGPFTSTGSVGGAGAYHAFNASVISGPENWLPGASMTAHRNAITLASNAGTPATASTAATANLALVVSSDAYVNPTSAIVLGADQDIAFLDVQFSSPGNQSFDLASPTAQSQFRSVRIYPTDIAAAQASIYAAIVRANVAGSPTPTDGIFDSGLNSRPDLGIGLGKLVDAHGDRYLLMRPTRVGDLNLDGTVNILDFINLASNFNSTNATWDQGDINYDGLVNILDFIALAGNFNTTYSGETFPISAADAATLANFAATNVPEPSIFIPFLPLFTLHARRRNRRSTIP